MAKQQKNDKVEMLERGEIFFLYRPEVEEADSKSDGKGSEGSEVKGLQDVQRFYMLLQPENSRNRRMLIVGRKRLPEADQTGQRHWGFVDAVLRTDKQLQDEVGPEQYETKTRGERLLPSMRPAGAGAYEISRHGDHTHLSYKLAEPEKPKEVQDDLNIAREASYIISIKNPDAASPRGVGLEGNQKAELPKSLQERFKNRRFVDVDPPQFLDHEGVEILLISTDDTLQELGIDFEDSGSELEKDAAEIFEALRTGGPGEEDEPLHSGQWR